MNEAALTDYDPDDPHRQLRWAIADAIRERLNASEMQMPGVMPPQPWDSEPEFDGLVSIYELAAAVVDAVLAAGVPPVRPDEETTP